MANLQPVRFSDDSATALACVSALTRAAIAGELVDDIRTHPSISHLNVARVVNWAIETMAGPTVFGADSDEFGEVLALCHALGTPVPASGILSKVALQLLINQLLKLLQDSLADSVEG